MKMRYIDVDLQGLTKGMEELVKANIEWQDIIVVPTFAETGLVARGYRLFWLERTAVP